MERNLKTQRQTMWCWKTLTQSHVFFNHSDVRYLHAFPMLYATMCNCLYGTQRK